VELVNRTVVPARIDVGTKGASGLRRGMVVAKATFRLTDRGATLERDDPFGVFLRDEATPFGVLPRDDLPRLDPAFEVVLIGSAYAPAGGATHVRIALQVGERRREIDVLGDRAWVKAGDRVTISAPATFDRMPLTWSRAFGGTARVLVDDASPVEIAHPLNPQGKGFDPAPPARAIADEIGCPPGYPKLPPERLLPNLEAPDARITTWDAQPEPVCWAPVPPTSGIHSRRSQCIEPSPDGTPRVRELPGQFHRAAPEWVFERPPDPGTPVRLEGLTPEGAASFSLPDLGVHIDYAVGARAGTRPLAPHSLVIMPDAGRFYLVYRLAFEIEDPDRSDRIARLRIEERLS
jgi:hypothetical protein